MAISKYNIQNLPNVIEGLPVVQDEEKAVHCLMNEKVPIARYEFGYSMMPILRSGQFCKIRPLEHNEEAKVGDALFCKVNNVIGTHMVLCKSKIDQNRIWYLIGMTDMQPIGWTDCIFGIATAMDHIVEPTFNRFFG